MAIESHRGDEAVARELVERIVDSGADRTVLPLTVAVRLAIVDTLTRESRAGFGIEGTAFPLWRSSAALHGWVVGKDGRAWDPRFRLDPMFADADVALLGRQDFFRAFTITFQEHATTPVYHLDPA